MLRSFLLNSSLISSSTDDLFRHLQAKLACVKKMCELTLFLFFLFQNDQFLIPRVSDKIRIQKSRDGK